MIWSERAKFGGNTCKNGRVTAVKAKFQNGGCRHLGFYLMSNLTANLIPGRYFELFAKFGANTCKNGRVMVIKAKFQNGGAAILDFVVFKF